MVSVLGFQPRPASAQLAITGVVTDVVTNVQETLGNIFDKITEAYNKLQKQIEKGEKETAGAAFRKGVEFFTQKIARDTALWIASGAKGQGPLFITQGWGAYMKDAADGAAGAIMDDLTKPTVTECEREQISSEDEFGAKTSTPGPCKKDANGKIITKVKSPGGIFEGLGLCNPDISTNLQINLGLLPARQKKPSCTFSVLKNNWEQEIAKASFLPNLQQSFDPSQNDLGIALNLQTNLLEQQKQKQLEVFGARLEGSGFKPSTSGADGTVKTPATAVAGILDKTFGTSLSAQLAPTGTILGDAMSVFTNTLASSFLTNIIKQGLGALSGNSLEGGRGLPGGPSLVNPEAQPQVEGSVAAKARLAREVQGNFTTPGRYDILSQLVACPHADNPGPNDCVITDKISTAISQKMTVKEAISKGLINSKGPFGFTGWDPAPIEPTYTDGLPYRSILILRKYRIVPVGWEVAARYIQQFGKQQVSLEDIIRGYEDTNSQFYHLIDENWVLSVPEAYCKVSGPGPQIVSAQVAQGVDLNKDGKFDGPDEQPPSVQLKRNDYCADEQTCIEKNENGTCKFFGYCTEEKRVWDFGAGVCNPVFNSCATLENKQTGQTVSYLLNTVDFDHCDSGAAGCKQYSRVPQADTGEPDGQGWSEAAVNTVYLNAQAKACDQENAGCRAFIKTGLGLPEGSGKGVNILTNGSFELKVDETHASGWELTFAGGTVTNAAPGAQEGQNYLTKLSEAKQQFSFAMPVVGQNMTLSFWARGTVGSPVEAVGRWIKPDGTSPAAIAISFDDPQDGKLTSATEWQRYYAVFTLTDSVPIGSRWELKIFGSGFDLDAVKLETSANTNPSYTPYGIGNGGTGIIHLKRPAPGTCSVSEANTPACQPFARRCSPAEVGCLAYAPTTGAPTITATRGDQCPAECVGYDTYVQSKTYFESAAQATLIPKTAKSCSAAAVGCDEFTNLDEVAKGGEGKEYYQRLRFCQKPTVGEDGETYYTWEGSDTVGFQLKVFTLLPTNNTKTEPANGGDPESAPCVYASLTGGGGSMECKDDSQTLSSWNDLADQRYCTALDLGQNPDCRQFYNAAGDVSYRLLSRTISITDSCKPYRKTIAIETDCDDSGGFWDGVACIYQAVPTEGKKCSAPAAGCREYRGGASANYRVISSDDFEKGTGNWSGGKLSAVAKDVGGHSYELPIGATMTKNVAIATTAQTGDAAQTTSLQLLFSGRSQTAGSVKIKMKQTDLATAAVTTFADVTVATTTEWEQQRRDPIVISVNKGSDLTMQFEATGGAPIYLDNIILQSNINTFYLIKNSSVVPGACLPGTGGALLGCQSYRVSDGVARNVWRFGDSCNAEVVGCQALIDTQNSTVGEAAAFSSTLKGQTTPADAMDFFVDSKDKRCNGSAQGCSALGVKNDVATHWEHVCKNNTQKACLSDDDCGAEDSCLVRPRYLKDNPDEYSTTLCAANQTQCAAFATDAGSTLYFKDPGGTACQYREGGVQAGWYLPFAKVCASDNTTFCQDSGDCSGGLCAAPTKPNCSNVSDAAPRTLLSGGYETNKNFAEPALGHVGACPTVQNSCREYIDPRSDDQRNLIYNGDFVLQTSGALPANPPDGWKGTVALKDYDAASGVKVAETTTADDHDGLRQTVSLRGQTIYILSSDIKENTSESAAAFVGLRDCRPDPIESMPISCSAADANNDGDIIGSDVTQAINNLTGGCPAAPAKCFGDLNGDGSVMGNEITTMILAVANGEKCVEEAGPWVYSPDNSMLSLRFGASKNEAGLGTYITPTDLAKSRRVSGQFYITHPGNYKCDVVIGTGGIAKDRVSPGEPDLAAGTAGHWFTHVSLRPANVAYQLASKVDRQSCAGVVNNDGGCVLFNEREVSNDRSATNNGKTAYTGMAFNANIDDSGSPSTTFDVTKKEFGTCVAATKKCSNLITRTCVNDADCHLPFNANTLLKVTPDRACAAWLSCRTARTVTENGVTKNICLDVQTCEKLDEKGGCASPVLTESASNDLNFNRASVDQLRNRSGYSKVGFTWRACSVQSGNTPQWCTTDAQCTATGGPTSKCEDRIVYGALSPAYMSQVGQAVNIYNGNFEVASPTGNPSGWFGWSAGENMQVINNPLAAQKVGIEYPREGRNFLEVNANHPVPVTTTDLVQPEAYQPIANMSSFIPVVANTEYTISAYINTLHFTGDNAEVRVLEYTGASSATYVDVAGEPATKYRLRLKTDPGLGWILRTDKFKTEPATNYIRLMFAWHDDGTPGAANYKGNGYWYIDDLKLQPALQLRVTNPAYAGQSCQLYPQQDALSCKYFDDKGLIQRGKQGYCLEWDSRNSNYCLQWWPVDSIIGEDSEQDRAGYNDRVPLYYCLDSTDVQAQGSRRIDIGDNDLAFKKVAVEAEEQQNPASVVCFGPGQDFDDGDNSFCDGRSFCSATYCLSAKDALVTGDGYRSPQTFESSEPTSDDDSFAVWSYHKAFDRFHGTSTPTAGDPWHRSANYFELWVIVNRSTNVIDHFAWHYFDDSSNTKAITFPAPVVYGQYCQSLAMTVTPSGQGQAIVSRIQSGSQYQLPNTKYTLTTNASPFGAIVPPSPVDEPRSWDTLGIAGNQPLFALGKNNTLAHAGSPYACHSTNALVQSNMCAVGALPTASQGVAELRNLFVQSYGIWSWQKVCLGGAEEGHACPPATCAGSSCGYRYNVDASINGLQEPTIACIDGDRAKGPVGGPVTDQCGVAPTMPSAPIADPVTLSRIGTTVLSFTFKADPDQLPVTKYVVDWGDGTKSVQAGLHLQSHPTASNAITLLHTYTYVDVARCWAETTGADPCKTRMERMGSSKDATSSFTLQPRVQVTDNWNWCNGSAASGYHGSGCSDNTCYAGGETTCAWTKASKTIKVQQ